MPNAAPAAPKSLQIFKPGRHTTAAGEPLAFSESDLAASAAAYDPAVSEAPLVIGHPSMDAPAYGWVGALSLAAGALEASPRDVNPEFAEMVNQRAYGKVSAAFYRPDDPANPKPGVWYLRHVGFLGARAPAVKGLRTPSFAGDASLVVEFSEWDDSTNASLWRGLRDWLIGKFGLAEADQVVPGYAVGDLERGAQDEIRQAQAGTDQPAVPAFSEPEHTVTEEQRAALEAENQRLRAQLAQRDAERTAEQRATRISTAHAANVAFAEGLVTQARLPVERAPVIVALLDLVEEREADGTAAVEFGEGEARAPLAPAFRELLNSIPPGVEFAEVATGARAASDTSPGLVEFAAPEGAVVDASSLAVHRKVVAYRAAHPEADYGAALQAVQAGRA